MLATLLASGCADELQVPVKMIYPIGMPAEITLDFDLGEVEAITRADIQEGLDRLVSSLWVAVYNVETGARTGYAEFTPGDEFSSFHENKKIKLTTLSGPSYIVAVANYDFRYASGDDNGKLVVMGEVLENADTWDKYSNIAAAFDKDGGFSASAPLNALMMSGFYTEDKHTDGSRPSLAAVDIHPGMSTLEGAIHLRRLISQVKFNVRFNTANIKSFVLDSWQVCNVPTHSWALERTGDQLPLNSPDARPAGTTRYEDTALSTEATLSGDTYSFDYWQLENKRTGLPAPDGSTSYAFREKEYKDAEGNNTGIFTSLVADPSDVDNPNNNASYVRIHVTMEMSVDENGKALSHSGIASRMVETEYVVHLGYVNNDPTDFNCLRNTIYTYNVTINNVNDVLVEARKDGETNPAVEGFVSDITDSYYELDAHYNAFNIFLSDTEIKDFEYIVQATKLDGSQVYFNSMTDGSIPDQNDSDFMYMGWVELRPTTDKNTLALYKPRTGPNANGNTYTLDEVKSSCRSGWYTVFVNEYVYEEGKYAGGNELGSKAWHGYVNRPDRKAWLYVKVEESSDRKSMQYSSKYALSQMSIQTYYNDDTYRAIGIEHTNESVGLNMRNDFNHRNNSERGGTNADAPRFNLAQYLTDATGSKLEWVEDKLIWSSFLNPTVPQTINAINNQNVARSARTEPLPELKTRSSDCTYDSYSIAERLYDPDQTSKAKYIEAITACLNRNRDLDGDGRIDAGELRWYVPTAGQYVRIILGRRSLTHPLMDYSLNSRLPNNRGDENGENSSLMLYCSDGKQIWAMEGTSTSDWRQWGGGAPWHVRCARNLGTNMNEIKKENPSTPAFEIRKGANIIDLKYYDARSVRNEAYHSADYPMPVHLITDQDYNRCYRSFEFHDSVIPLNDLRIGLTGKLKWDEYLKDNNPCKYLEKQTGKKGWRVPNQKEATTMAILGKYNVNSNGVTLQVSCTYSFFDREGYAPAQNPNYNGFTLFGGYRFPMKVNSNTGNSTQGGLIQTLDGLLYPSDDYPTVNISQYGVRCVRDVTE